MEKSKSGFIDPSVADLLNSGNRAREERSLPRAERTRKKKAANRQAERNGKRAVYDLDPDLIKVVADLARENGTTASMVAGILLPYALEAIENGELDLSKYRHILPRNPRYEYELVWKEEK